MDSDPGSELPPVQEFSQKENSDHKKPGGERCSICGLVARNKIELDDHIKHAHRQGESLTIQMIYIQASKKLIHS